MTDECYRRVLPRELLCEIVHFFPSMCCHSLLSVNGGSGSAHFDSYLCNHARKLIDRQQFIELFGLILKLTRCRYYEFEDEQYADRYTTKAGDIKQNKCIQLVYKGHSLYKMCNRTLEEISNNCFNDDEYRPKIEHVIEEFSQYSQQWQKNKEPELGKIESPFDPNSAHPINSMINRLKQRFNIVAVHHQLANVAPGPSHSSHPGGEMGGQEEDENEE